MVSAKVDKPLSSRGHKICCSRRRLRAVSGRKVSNFSELGGLESMAVAVWARKSLQWGHIQYLSGTGRAGCRLHSWLLFGPEGRLKSILHTSKQSSH